jgi:hypothetical protein
MAKTYTPIATHTLPSAATSYTFSSVPNTYTDLILVSSVNSARAAQYDSLAIRFNSDSSSIYSYTYLMGNTSYGSSPISGRATSQNNIFIGNFTSNSVANNFSSNIVHIKSYGNTNVYKTIICSGGGIIDSTNNDMEKIVGLYKSSSAISSITVRSETGSNITAGSTFTLYGVKSA